MIALFILYAFHFFFNCETSLLSPIPSYLIDQEQSTVESLGN